MLKCTNLLGSTMPEEDVFLSALQHVGKLDINVEAGYCQILSLS